MSTRFGWTITSTERPQGRYCLRPNFITFSPSAMRSLTTLQLWRRDWFIFSTDWVMAYRSPGGLICFISKAVRESKSAISRWSRWSSWFNQTLISSQTFIWLPVGRKLVSRTPVVSRLSLTYIVCKNSWLGLCKLKNEILKGAKNSENCCKITFSDRKVSFLSVFSLFQNLIFLLGQL